MLRCSAEHAFCSLEYVFHLAMGSKRADNFVETERKDKNSETQVHDKAKNTCFCFVQKVGVKLDNVFLKQRFKSLQLGFLARLLQRAEGLHNISCL